MAESNPVRMAIKKGLTVVAKSRGPLVCRGKVLVFCGRWPWSQALKDKWTLMFKSMEVSSQSLFRTFPAPEMGWSGRDKHREGLGDEVESYPWQEAMSLEVVSSV